jgi:hypothetical protein
MNKKQILASLNKIANELDNTGLYTEANSITKVMTRLAQEKSDFDDEFGDDELTNAQKEAYQIYSEFDISKNSNFEKLNDEDKYRANRANKNWLDYYFKLFPKSFGEPQLRNLDFISKTHNFYAKSSTNIFNIENPIEAQNFIIEALIAKEKIQNS